MPITTLNHESYPTERVVAAKARRLITVCLPAHNEATTIGPIVAAIGADLMGPVGLVDELLVIDDGSDDATTAEARSSGATVVRARGSRPGHPVGKGGAMRTGAARASG